MVRDWTARHPRFEDTWRSGRRALPQAERLALDNRRSPHFRGYTRLGHEITAGRPDARANSSSCETAKSAVRSPSPRPRTISSRT